MTQDTKANLKKRIISGIFIALILSLLFLLNCWQFNLFIALILLEILIFEWPNFFSPKTIKFWIVFLFYPTIPLILLSSLFCYNKLLVLLIFIMVFSHDTGSYIFGKSIGKTKIAPKISPKKTWEGFAGGYLLNIVTTSIFFNFFYNLSFSLSTSTFIIIFTLIVSVFAFLGDLFESYLKRKAHIKDSGSILPGHGGILDRIDGVLFVIIIFIIFKSQLLNLTLIK